MPIYIKLVLDNTFMHMFLCPYILLKSITTVDNILVLIQYFTYY